MDDITQDDREAFALIKECIEDPKIGIRADLREPIIDLFQYGLLKVPMNTEVRKKWTELGFLEDNKLAINPEYIDVELSMMALCWDGKLIRTKVPV